MQDIAVLKFGGSSLKSVARIQHVAEVIRNFPARKKVVVVSAMGDSTDHLIKLAKQCNLQPEGRELDILLATGEQVSIALLAITLGSHGIQAKSYTGPQLGILTDSVHSTARILDIDERRLRSVISQNDVVVIAGFQGCNSEGDVTTLGRGGSDTSAVAVAAALEIEDCHIFTDVDGVFSADPRHVADARFIPSITYKETLELARSGAQVIHPRAVELAEDYAIRLHVRNTFNTEHEGTLIQGDNLMERKHCLTAVATENNVACIEIKGAEDSSLPLETLKTSSRILADSVSYSSNDKDSTVLIAFKYVDEDEFDCWVERLNGQLELCEIKKDSDVAKITLVGNGLTGNSECLPKFISTLQKNKIKPQHVTCHDSGISAIISREHAKTAAQLIHAEFLSQIPCAPTQPCTVSAA